GMAPGSMPLATEIFQEGFRLPPVRLIVRGRPQPDVLALFLANTRVREEREGDLMAQWAALRVGAERLRALLMRTGGVDRLARQMAALQAYSAALMRASLARIPRGVYRARDLLDDDGLGTERIPIAVAITIGRGEACIDFSGSAPQTRGPVNANFAVTRSAVLYVFTALAPEPIPPNEGLAWPLRIEALEASYPLRVRRQAVRRGSGGRGRHRGGDGIVRELEFLVPTEVTLLAERRRIPPYGLAGGEAGAPGRDLLIRAGRARRVAA